jgi:antitoxin (DNA-binding transcriptional repressor) of toxin-antitoxin stability system
MQALLQRARAGEPITLTLCGERIAQTWQNTRPRGALARVGHLITSLRGATPAWKHLEVL